MRTLTARVSVVALATACLLLLAPALHAQPADRAKITKTAFDRTAYHAGDKGTAAIVLEIPQGFHAQSRTPLEEFLIKFQLKVDKVDAVTFGEVVYPPAVIEDYPKLGKVSVYTGKVVLLVPFEVKADAPAGDLKLAGSLMYQLCDDAACYAPEKPKWSAATKVVAKGEETKANEADAELFKKGAEAPTRAGTAATQAATAGATLPPPPAAAQSAGAPPVIVEAQGANWGLATALGVAFLAGIIFNAVPCVLPVLPIKVLGFAEVAQHNRGRTVFLASVFGLGIVSVFAALALFILVLKRIQWGQQFSNPWFAWGMVGVLLLLSLWLFGILNVNLPAGAYAFAPRHDTLTGNFEWGVLTAVLSTPCTGPFFPPVIAWAATQPRAIGVLAMMMVGVGMAFPYIVLSAFPEAARRFPRVGPWSELFKQMLGFILLAFTVFFAAGRFLHGGGPWWAVVPVTMLAGLYLMARTVQLSKDAKPVAISSFVSVAMVTIAVMIAFRFTDTSFASAAPGRGGVASAESVSWTPYSDEAFNAARKANKLVLVKFTANWCLNCQYVEATVFHDPDAIAALRKHDVVTLKADLTEDDAAGWPRLHSISATGGIPLTAIYAPGYDKPVPISAVYTTATLVKTLDQIDPTRTASAAAQ
jgi:thiol:disulfide interchange protein